jgi:hypothetical protein
MVCSSCRSTNCCGCRPDWCTGSHIDSHILQSSIELSIDINFTIFNHEHCEDVSRDQQSWNEIALPTSKHVIILLFYVLNLALFCNVRASSTF